MHVIVGMIALALQAAEFILWFRPAPQVVVVVIGGVVLAISPHAFYKYIRS